MPEGFTAENRESRLCNPEIVELVAERLQELRKRLLDSSRRNPLINIPLKANSTNILRVVDELPDILRFNLTNGTSMRLAPLPALEEELPDEQTDAFLDALHLARREDEKYLAEVENLDPASKSFAEMEFRTERNLKDRVRAALGLPERQTKDRLSLTEHAKAHGISPSYTLPSPDDEHDDGRHQDDHIQTLMLPEKLSRVAKGLLEKGRGFERETGVNVLHAVFGLLEWRSPGERDKYVSPLLLLEIRIERKQSPQGAQFYISGDGRAFVNTTLKQKFFTEHQLDLPEYEAGSIEDYFEKVGEAAPKGWDWRVRREVVFGIFPSSKIAMYHDLDPDKRPVAENPVVGRLLATTGSGESAYAEIYGTDVPEIARKVPHLVMDADASQFSALVDVADGEHLSIEGPPGSGKSQTIVNLIAAALADGKKVLFVAEKLTALDVVKNRLEAAGLGEFILPLQAGRGTRDKVYQSLEERLAVEPADLRVQRNFTSRQDALERRRQVLQNYLDALGAEFGSSGFTVYEVIGHGIATADIRNKVPKEIRRTRLANAETLGAARIDAIVADADAFAERLGRLRRMPALWLDTRAKALNRDDAEDICERARYLADRLDDFQCSPYTSELAPLLKGTVFEADLEDLQSLLQATTEHGTGIDKALIETLLSDPERRRAVRDLCAQIQAYRSTLARLARTLSDPERRDLPERLDEARRFAAANEDAISPAAHRGRLEALDADLAAARRTLAAARNLPANLADDPSRTLAMIQDQARRLIAAPPEVRGLRRTDPSRHAETLARRLTDTQHQLSTALRRIRQALPNAYQHDPTMILAAAETIASAGMLRFMSGEYKRACNTYTGTLRGAPGEDRRSMAQKLRAYGAWLEERRRFEEDTAFKAAYGALFKGFATDAATIQTVADFYKLCATIAGPNETLRAALESGDLASVEAMATLDDMPDVPLEVVVQQVARLQEERDVEARRVEEAGRHLRLFSEREQVALTEVIEIQDHVRQGTELSEAIHALPAAALLGDRFQGIMTCADTLNLECDFAERLAATSDPALAVTILRSGRASALIATLSEFAERRRALDTEAATFAELVDLAEKCRGTQALAARVADLREAAADPSFLMERARLHRSEEILREHGLGSLADWAMSNGDAFDPEGFGPLTRAVIAKAMADRAFELHADRLQGYDGEDFARIRAEIAEKDRQLIAMSRSVVRNKLIADARPPAGNGIGRKSSYTDMSLIRNEMGKKKNRIGVRELSARAGAALLELKPCWMMSPLAVAQYLHSGLAFDLTVIDEASQMTPENAIGALSRGLQAVVVGDTKQLPPTSFFQKMLDDTDTDEDIREDSESILDMANVAFRPVRQLRWHYRSRHSALISFSNKWMYDDKLTIFPSAREDDPEFGVHLIEVAGTYSGRTNKTEASAVVKAVLAHMQKTPDLSLGVCTMNLDQKERILEEFERERERHRHVQDFVKAWEERNDALEEFFIKNLETIQGDERDVLFISTLYGPETLGGRPHQRFGPINSAHGHRRLNVLFTRAKRKIVTFTSLKPTDILVDDGKARGVHMFRAWLEYCKSGAVPDQARRGGEADSPFEEYVASQIEAMGCEAVPQVGAAGYRIDIGVRHPDWPYGYILGVECDGASYHSSRSSRDRDRLRQEVLEGLGWHFHRIWSTDWFNDPRTQIDRLRDAIDAALDRARAGHTSGSCVAVERLAPAEAAQETAVKAPDSGSPADIRHVDRSCARTGPGLVAEGVPKATGRTATAGPSVSLGCYVKIENLSEGGRKLAFTLVEERSNLENGQLSINSPLGQALLDAQVGDEVEYQVGVHVKEVRVLAIAGDLENPSGEPDARHLAHS